MQYIHQCSLSQYVCTVTSRYFSLYNLSDLKCTFFMVNMFYELQNLQYITIRFSVEFLLSL
jgi:hypothetical protein